MTSINDATPEEWDAVAKKFDSYKTGGNKYQKARKKQEKFSTTTHTPEDYNKYYTNVHSPAHYNQGQTECIDAIEAMLSVEEYVGYLRGNSMKYRWRFRYKNGFEDLSKAEWYERRLVKFMEDHNVLGSKG